MAHPLAEFWHRLFPDAQERVARGGPLDSVELPDDASGSTASIFLILRRMRLPLITFISIFAISVLGLSLMPGYDAQGSPQRLTVFDALYVMSYTATTIGFGEIPHAFSPEQRMWVTFSIYLSVVGWAYMIGSLLGLLQDQGFRRALRARRTIRKISHLREPFGLIVGYGDTGALLAGYFDAVGRRMVVLESDEDRIAAAQLAAYRADVPVVLGDAREADRLIEAGLGHRYCSAVLAVTGDDAANLSVVMAAALLRPDLQVVAGTVSPSIARRMAAFGDPVVVNPLDRAGDHLRILLRSPAAYQLMMWLTGTVGSPLPALRPPVPAGRWVVCGAGHFAHEVAADLGRSGLDVAMVDPADALGDLPGSEVGIAGDLLEGAVGFVAATESDTDNLSLVEEVTELGRDLFVVARQNAAANDTLYRALDVDYVLVRAELMSHEVLARIANPLLLDFLVRVPGQPAGWAEAVVDRLVQRCGTRLPRLRSVRLDAREAPTLIPLLSTGTVALGDLLRSPADRDQPLAAVPLLVRRGEEIVLAPPDDFVLADGDELMIAAGESARRGLDATLNDPPTAAYVLSGEQVASSWIWRRLTGARSPVS